MSSQEVKILLSHASVFVNEDHSLTLNCYTSNPHNFMGTPYTENVPLGDLDYDGIVRRLKYGYHNKYNKSKFEFDENRYEVEKIIFEFTFKPINYNNSNLLEEIFICIKNTKLNGSVVIQ